MYAVLGKTTNRTGFFMLWHDDLSYNSIVGKEPRSIPVVCQSTCAQSSPRHRKSSAVFCVSGENHVLRD